jgi:hypothetical protein
MFSSVGQRQFGGYVVKHKGSGAAAPDGSADDAQGDDGATLG